MRPREARLQEQLQATGYSSVEKVLLRLLDTQGEQDRWLLENQEVIDAKIKRGIDQLDRGEGIPEDRLDAYLANLKPSLNERSLRPCTRNRARTCPNLALHRETK